MNDNTQKLLDALRSGAYEQARNQLRAENSEGGYAYCCLGVACEISGLGEWRGETRYTIGDPEDYHNVDTSGTRLPPSVAEWLGWANRDGNWSTHDGAIGLNDTGIPFPEIADAIERNFNGLTSYKQST